LGGDELLGSSAPIERTRKMISSIAATDATVLILGESGCGKELAARSLHRQSGRTGRFVAMNMAAVPQELAESMLFGHEKGAFTGADRQRVGCCEEADGGTLLLDEIGEMAPALQAKLLRFLQERAIMRIGSSRPVTLDVRIIAATHRDLGQQIKDGKFREDLYYRLHEIPLRLPPLRDRPEDVAILASHFLHRALARFRKETIRLHPEVVEVLQAYSWPGNVRELENLIHRLVILAEGDSIGLQGLPEEFFNVAPKEPAVAAGVEAIHSLKLDAIEQETIREALRTCRGQVGAAAYRLGVSPATLYRKIKRLNLPIEDYRV
jgi:DNA-binding NtrC family response regulator